MDPSHRPRARPAVWPLLTMLAAGLLGGCGGGQLARREAHYTPLSCAPFARALTGVALRGDAASWWGQAAGRYRRTNQPEEGAVLVLAVEPRLPHGHVAVVSRVRDTGTIEVFQANWVPGELARDQPVVDVSGAGDWSLVRVWYPPVAGLGAHAYPALGFIVPEQPAGRAGLERRADAAEAGG